VFSLLAGPAWSTLRTSLGLRLRVVRQLALDVSDPLDCREGGLESWSER
jgi:hypothetical protein